MICQDQRSFSRRNHWLTLARQCVLPAVPGALHRNVIILIIFSNSSSSSFPLSSAGWRKKNRERSSFKCIILGLPTFLPRNLRARPPPRSVIGTLLAIFPRSCFKVRFFAFQIINFCWVPGQSRFFSFSSCWSWRVAKRVLKIMLSYDSSSASVLPRASCPVVWVGSLLQGVGGFGAKKSCWKEFPYSCRFSPLLWTFACCCSCAFAIVVFCIFIPFCLSWGKSRWTCNILLAWLSYFWI